jgi:hypothetical protein
LNVYHFNEVEGIVMCLWCCWKDLDDSNLTEFTVAPPAQAILVKTKEASRFFKSQFFSTTGDICQMVLSYTNHE